MSTDTILERIESLMLDSESYDAEFLEERRPVRKKHDKSSKARKARRKAKIKRRRNKAKIKVARRKKARIMKRAGYKKRAERNAKRGLTPTGRRKKRYINKV